MSNFKSLEVWTAQTICDVGILLSIISFLFHMGRPYFDRITGRFTLRVAADLWWIVYIILRDGTLFFSILFGFLNLNLDLMADVKIGLPFVPLGTVALAAALSMKIFRNTEDINKSFRISVYLVTLGAFLNTIGYVLVMEAPGDEYAVAKTAFWETMRSWRSNANPELATITFYITFALLVGIVITAALKSMFIYRKIEKENERIIEGKNVQT